MRKEIDALGEMMLPDDVYYGIQTERNRRCLDITDDTISAYPALIAAIAQVKKACALTNKEIGALDPDKAAAIVQACDEMTAGRFNDAFPLCIFRGSGTPFNMAANEVLGNRANEILTGHKGADAVHPNTHVNMCQSSNDVVPTAKTIAVWNEIGRVIAAAEHLEKAFSQKAEEFADVVKMGRTCLQDAVPITLGQEFSGYAAAMRRNRLRLEEERGHWCGGVLGATAVGTGMGCMPGYTDTIYKNLSAVCGREIHCDANLFDGLQASDGFIVLHAHLLALATAAAKAAYDIRLMGSGPRAGMGELVLPAVQPGSSIMPGKINPVMAEVMILACHRVAGNQAGTGFGAFSGELDLGPSSAVPIRGILESIDILTRAMTLFADKCVAGLAANEEHCRAAAESSTSLATMVSALFGYKVGSRVAKLAWNEGITCREAAERENLLTHEQADDLFDLLALTDVRKTEALFKKYSDIRDV
ncbi:MAG: lyase family protein [Desulfovibrionaceae bacterium]|nr:lyase family protein [Desulfovibrionaceae bacterium]